jgi:hypothetical protein
MESLLTRIYLKLNTTVYSIYSISDTAKNSHPPFSHAHLLSVGFELFFQNDLDISRLWSPSASNICKMDITVILNVIAGVGWTITYIDIIRVGFKDKTYGMPAALLPLNLSWELVFAYNGLTSLNLQFWINVSWVLADIVIWATFILYGRREMSFHIPRLVFVIGSFLALLLSLAMQLALIVELGWFVASYYSAFLSNVVMSVEFIRMCISRGGVRGQSQIIAVSKCIGTFCFTILYGYFHFSLLTLVLGGICFLLDIVYIALVGWAVMNVGSFKESFAKRHTTAVISA